MVLRGKFEDRVNTSPTVVSGQTDKEGNIYISYMETNEVGNAHRIVLVREAGLLGGVMGMRVESRHL